MSREVANLTRTKNSLKKSFQLWLPELFLEAYFILKTAIIYDFLEGNNYPDSPHLQWGMKFATHISPLLD